MPAGKFPDLSAREKKPLKMASEYSTIAESGLNIIPAVIPQKMRGVSIMKKSFGHLPSGAEVFLYTISCGGITATVSDLGATLVLSLIHI